MPTGYTKDVADGTITSLKEYALICARAMGALITMRDEPEDAEIPKQLKVDPYYINEIEKIKSVIAGLSNKHPMECDSLAALEYELSVEKRNKKFIKNEETKHRYDSMLEKLDSWKCGAEGLWAFMVGQLHTSIEFDCMTLEQINCFYPEPIKLSGEEWKKRTLEKLEQDLRYYEEEHQKEIKRIHERNQWLNDLHSSFGEDGITYTRKKMNILDAARSGKEFKRQHHGIWFIAIVNQYCRHYDRGDMEIGVLQCDEEQDCYHGISKEDFFANDWIIK